MCLYLDNRRGLCYNQLCMSRNMLSANHYKSSPKGQDMNKFTKLILLLFTILTLAATVVSCAGDSSTSTYTIISPSVDPGGELRGSDFIMVSEFSKEKYTVSLNDEIDTSLPGRHTVSITVKNKNGYKRTLDAVYTVRSYLYDSVRVEAGSGVVSIDKFINRKVMKDPSAHTVRFRDELLVASYTLGTHTVEIFVDEMLMQATLIIEDTVAPTASPVTVFITDASKTPKADDFVTDVKDATGVICEFKESYDFNTTSDVNVIIVLTDEAGNSTEVEALATCSVDTEPPVIEGVQDITVVLGESVSYKSGVTVTDNSGESIKVSVDNSRVNLKAVGVYEVSYSATDSAGNSTIVRATVTVIEAPKATEADVAELAEKVYKSLYTDGMTKWDIAFAIYNWTHDSITYVDVETTIDDSVQAAYDGFSDLKGDCLTYMTVAEALLKQAGIPTKRIERLKYENEANHYWLLVDIGDGWYHFDACWRLKNKPFEPFMRTDAELAEYCTEYEIEYYYRFDKSKYPSRGTVSYYSAAETTPDPTVE